MNAASAEGSSDEASLVEDVDGRFLLRSHATVYKQLYLSHFLSTWSSRVFEFGSVLYLAAIFPDSLLPMSMYALVRGLSAIVFASSIGHYVDHGQRLKVVRNAILWQRLVVASSCLGFWLLLHDSISTPISIAIMFLLIIFACIEKVAAIVNLISIERDWVVVLAKDSAPTLRALNAQMRRIDLLCKLLGPFAIATVAAYSIRLAILANLVMNLASTLIEYPAIKWVYDSERALQEPRSSCSQESDEVLNHERPSHGSMRLFVSFGQDLRRYAEHNVFLPSFACALLYCTALSFGGQMVAFLLAKGFIATQIAIARTAAVVLELSATWAAPFLINRIGATRAGLWFIVWQSTCLGIGAWLFCSDRLDSTLSSSALILSVVLSRIGLWGYDLSSQTLVQDGVEADSRGMFSGMETGWQNFFELLSYLFTIIYSHPSQFAVPVLISCSAVWSACFLHCLYVRSRRGHLFHLSRFLSLIPHQKRDTDPRLDYHSHFLSSSDPSLHQQP